MRRRAEALAYERDHAFVRFRSIMRGVGLRSYSVKSLVLRLADWRR